MEMNEFLKERDEALFSLDIDKIRAYQRKYEIRLQANDEVFWCSVHKAICQITNAPPYIRARSVTWLEERGYSTMLGKNSRIRISNGAT